MLLRLPAGQPHFAGCSACAAAAQCSRERCAAVHRLAGAARPAARMHAGAAPPPPTRDLDLGLHDVHACDLLRHRVLHLRREGRGGRGWGAGGGSWRGGQGGSCRAQGPVARANAAAAAAAAACVALPRRPGQHTAGAARPPEGAGRQVRGGAARRAHLHARVDLQEVVPPALVHHELHGAGVLVVDVLAQPHRVRVQRLPHAVRQVVGGSHLHHLGRGGGGGQGGGEGAGGGRRQQLLGRSGGPAGPAGPDGPGPGGPAAPAAVGAASAAAHLLVPALHGAVALVQVHHVAVGVCQDLGGGGGAGRGEIKGAVRGRLVRR
jgi:hypothetical protein